MKCVIETRVGGQGPDGNSWWSCSINGKPVKIGVEGKPPIIAQFQSRADADTWGVVLCQAQYGASEITYS